MAVTVNNKDEGAQSQLDGGKQLTTKMTAVKKVKVSKLESSLVGSNVLTSDDAFADRYFDEKRNPKAEILRPPYDLVYMCVLIQNNNALAQCVAAMEVNIDGTGFTVEIPGKVESEEEDVKAEGIKDFFHEPYPGVSFTTQRRELRRDLESVGNGYLEVLRSISGEVVFTKRVDAVTVRMLCLDEPTTVTKTVKRFGKDEEIQMTMRERRFAQMVGSNVVYFKEYGASRDLNKTTGLWAEEGDVLPVDVRATEFIHFTVVKDAKSPYGVPRWINQVPSVIGSRRAEELNLDFFNAGGLPPALILVQGGQMTDEVRKNLQTYLSGKGASKHRAAIVETYSTAGSLDSNAGSVRVTVERFGAERQQDSMFEKYDERCEKRVRSSWRLPPLFVGKADDYSFATAFASYAVAEAQVFQPERDEFDEIINVTLMRAFDPEQRYTYRSMPLNVKDATQQLKAVELIRDLVDPDSAVEQINEIAHTKLKAKEEQDEPPVVLDNDGNPIPPAGKVPPQAAAQGAPPEPAAPGTPGVVKRVEKTDPLRLIQLSKSWAAYSSGDIEFEQAEIDSMYAEINVMKGTERDLFDSYVAMGVFSGFDHDPEGASELMGCATDILHSNGD